MKKEQIKITLCAVWQSLVALISPIWIGIMVMFITGHGKGYGYDLQDEADISVFMGVIVLLLWLAAILPGMIYLCKYFYRRKKPLAIVPIADFIILFIIGVLLIGPAEFIKMFPPG